MTARKRRKRLDADKGVQDCIALMTTNRWITGKSHQDIARKHGISPRTVKAWATSASRIIRATLEMDTEAVRARMLTALDTVIARALRPKGANLRAAVQAIEAQAKILGLVVQKHEIHMTEEQARAKYREITGQDWPSTAAEKSN